MEKKAIISLNTSEDNIKLSKLIEFKNNKINYLEDDNTNVLFDIDKMLLVRDSKDIYLEYDFLNGIGLIYIKELGTETRVNINVEGLKTEDKLIEIIYNIDDKKYEYRIEMEWYYEYY